MKFNYATVEITKESDDIKVSLAIKNYHNEDVISKEVSVKKDLQFTESKTVLNTMCEAAHKVSKKIFMINKLMKSTINDKNLVFMNDLFVVLITLGMITPLAIVIWVFSVVSKYCTKKKITHS